MSEENKQQYSADSIQALEGMEHVRMRPSMYIGDVGVRGLHHLVYEVIDNSIDEALAGHCNNISVFINEDNSITVRRRWTWYPCWHAQKRRCICTGGGDDKNWSRREIRQRLL